MYQVYLKCGIKFSIWKVYFSQHYKEELRLNELCTKEQNLISILDFAQIENNIRVVTITNIPKDTEELRRAFITKSVYNTQTTRDLIATCVAL